MVALSIALSVFIVFALLELLVSMSLPFVSLASLSYCHWFWLLTVSSRVVVQVAMAAA